MSRLAVVYKRPEDLPERLRDLVQAIDSPIGEIDFKDGVIGRDSDELRECNEFIGNTHALASMRAALTRVQGNFPCLRSILESPGEVYFYKESLESLSREIAFLRSVDSSDKFLIHLIDAVGRAVVAATSNGNGIRVS